MTGEGDMNGEKTTAQGERLRYLVQAFLQDSEGYAHLPVPPDEEGRRRLLRSLMNIRMPRELPRDVLKIQDEYLTERAREKGIHLVWVTHDLFDPRIISRQGVRDQINNYMRTVMREEPLDPSLEILHDEESW